jgi:hypothetical protein
MAKLRTNTLRYNTKTGKLVIPRSRFRFPYPDSVCYFEADLYKTKTGNYFLFGKGAAMTKFSSGTEDLILPITFEEAKEIGKEYLSKKDYESEFVTGNEK